MERNHHDLWLISLMWIACAFLMPAAYAQEFDVSLQETFDQEPPAIRRLLIQANALLAEETEIDSAWKAANHYCEASRYGSAEALYRLGMLYVVGKGVPENQRYAANLFGLASTHGHVEAQKMLETVAINATDAPPCVLADVLAEKATENTNAYADAPAIDAFIAQLPKHKRWVVDLANKVSNWHQVDSRLVLSIITAESNFKVAAQSNKDAQGLMQLIPETAERFHVKNAYNATQNIRGGVKYLRWLLAYFRGDVTLAVAAYNAGEHTVDKYRGVPPYKETKAYVKKVMGLYEKQYHSYDASITPASPILKGMRSKEQPTRKKRGEYVG